MDMCRGGTTELVYVIGRKLFANHHTHAADGVRHVAAKIVITIAGKKNPLFSFAMFSMSTMRSKNGCKRVGRPDGKQTSK